MMNYGPLNDAIEKYNVYPDAAHFGSFQEQYSEKYGVKGWTAHAVKDVFGKSASDKNAFAKGSAEYKAAQTSYNNSLRQVQRWANYGTGNGKQATNPMKASEGLREKLASIGKTLAPVSKNVPPGGITFVIKFHAPEDKGHAPRERSTPESGADVIHLDQSDALKFLYNPSYAELFDQWFDRGGETYGEDGAYEADVFYVSAA